MKHLLQKVLPDNSALLALGMGIILCVVFTPVFFQSSQKHFEFSTAHALDVLCGSGTGVHRCSLDDIGPESECRKDSTKCNESEKQILRIISGCSPDASVWGLVVGSPYSIDCSDTQIKESAQAAQIYAGTVTACVGLKWLSLTCIGRTLSVIIGTLLVSVTAWLLALAGLLFNLLVDHTVVTFGYLFSDTVGTAISTAWSAFRDVANIVIIGMFVFTAINIILGVKEFGQKKMIAKILIIAVLINFSLLFTKMIIDASNFTAMQFYNASTLSADVGASEGLNFTTFSRKGISGRFIDLMGVGSLAETSAAISAGAFGNAQTNYQNANGWMALLQGLVSATLLLAAALVLLYGCYLLASRAVLLIFLMLTSALAFASWLIPHHIVEQGWSTWWRSLLKTALFAPILMIFLWATLLVAASVTPAGGALGSLAAEPNSKLDLNALFSYVIVIGLLFASFKVSSAFSHTISGFGATGGALGLAALTPFGAASRIVGLGARTFVGGRASRGAADLKERIDKRVQDKGPGASMWERTRMRAGGWVGSRTFDPMNTKIAKTAANKFGALTFGDVVGKGGYIGVKERQARAALEAARKMGFVSVADTEQNTRAAIMKDQEDERKRLADEHATHKEAHDKAGDARTPAETEKKSALDRAREAAGQISIKDTREKQAALEAERNKHEATYQQEMTIQRQRIANAKKDTDEEREARAELARTEKARNTLVGGLNTSIEEVKRDVTQYDTAVEEAGTQAVKTKQQTAQAGMDKVKADREALDKIRDERVEHAGRVGSDEATARNIAAARPGTLYFFGNPAKDEASKRVIKAARVRVQREQALRISEAMKEVGATGEAAPKASAPPAAHTS